MNIAKELSEQKISKLLLKFSIPCVTGLLIGALYNIVDQIFIGNSSLGYLGNAATGISFPIICIANAFAWCIGDGAASYLSICAGRADSESAHKCVGNGLSATFIISIVFTILCLLLCEPLMILFGASDATLQLACDYFMIIALFFPFYLMFNVMNSMIRADGSPTYAMIAMLTGAIINIFLDPVCIFLLDWGIKGAAIATVVGQIMSFFICLNYFKKPKTFSLHKQSFRLQLPMMKNLITLGSSTFIIQISLVIMSILSNVMLFKYGNMSIYGSDIPISVFSIQTKVYTIVSNIVVGIALGGQPILGYNYGARKMDRVRQCYKYILVSSLTVGIISTLIFILYPQIIIGIFGKQNALYMSFATNSFRIFLSLCFITVFIKISSIFFQAIGKPKEAMAASVIRDMFCFVIFTIMFCYLIERYYPGFGVYGVLLAAPASDLIAGLVILILTIRFFKTLDAQPLADTNSCIEETRPGIIVTIDRLHGTGGRHIGTLLADKLAIPIYHKELRTIASKESGFSEEYLSSDYDEPTDTLNEAYLSTALGQQSMIVLEETIRKIADNGACVIVGQAANFILRNYHNVISIFLYAPEELRVKNLQEKYAITTEKAYQIMKESDESRAKYYQNITGSDWKDINGYDLCIDCSVGNEAILEIIETYLKSSNA
ncbi:MAG: MATE family efflux transporter [Erysipelotrichaceae bacterium]|nr:MATE family efflux transporter [Erysipelotrichaceae bacterium]MDY5251933.1 MATE family efflux transporter [Erysipelotrichaceae bacterium]